MKKAFSYLIRCHIVRGEQATEVADCRLKEGDLATTLEVIVLNPGQCVVEFRLTSHDLQRRH